MYTFVWACAFIYTQISLRVNVSTGLFCAKRDLLVKENLIIDWVLGLEKWHSKCNRLYVCWRILFPTLQRTATHYNTLLHIAARWNYCNIHCNTLQHAGAPCLLLLQRTATHCNALQRTAAYCNVLQRTAAHCNTLQHTATQWCTLVPSIYVSICMYIYMCVYVCMYVCIHDMYIYIRTCLPPHSSPLYMCVYTYVYIHACMCIYRCIYVYYVHTYEDMPPLPL